MPSAPALSEVTAPRRVSGRVFNRPQRSEHYWTHVRYSAEGTPTISLGRLTARLAGRPRAASRGRGFRPPRARPARFRGGAQIGRHAPWRPQATTRERRQLRPFCTAWTIGCASGVAARGRAASPTKRGQIVLFYKRLLKTCISKRVQVSGTRSDGSRSIGRHRGSIDRRRISEKSMPPDGPIPVGTAGRAHRCALLPPPGHTAGRANDDHGFKSN